MANTSLKECHVTCPQEERKNQEDITLKPWKPHISLSLPIEELDSPYKDVILSLPQERRWFGTLLRQYQGFWQQEGVLPEIISLQNSFKSRLNDIFIASFPKCGTTWVKAITFSIVNRNKYDFASHPLLRLNPHECVKFIEAPFGEGNYGNYLESLPSPRVLSFHIPYSVLPDSIKESECKIVYVGRDPKDALVSIWHMCKGFNADSSFPFSEAFELFCEGKSINGPIWEHMLEYWNESLKTPKNMLFLKYEDLLENPFGGVKNIADFLGYSFSKEEEMERIPEKIVELCSFRNLTDLDFNKKKDENTNLLDVNHIFFRKGGKGDWMNHMSLEMADKLDVITREQFEGSGLSFPSSAMEAIIDST